MATDAQALHVHVLVIILVVVLEDALRLPVLVVFCGGRDEAIGHCF
jgi:hypothetical protein